MKNNILLKEIIKPCTNAHLQTKGEGGRTDSYSLGKKGPGTFQLEYNFDIIADRIIVYNCPKKDITTSSPVFDTGIKKTSGFEKATIQYNSSIISIVVMVDGSFLKSYWEYHIICP